MGINARILLRKVPAELVSEEWLLEKSWMLARDFGASKFLIQDGLLPDEYDIAWKDWKSRIEGHWQYPEYQKSRDNQILIKIHSDIGDPPKPRYTAISKSDNDGQEYLQDGPSIVAENGECLLEVNIMSRYYGVGYERGDILTLGGIATWCEINIPGCEVWYGGDSSGVCAKPWGQDDRLELMRYAFGSHGRNYFKNNSTFSPDAEYGLPSPCSLCPNGKYRGQRYGFGANYSAFSCAGCGRKTSTRDGGKTWNELGK